MKHTGFYRQAWLIVARGGWWTAKEIIAEIDLQTSADYAVSMLCNMATKDGLLEKRGTRLKAEYAVTRNCSIPRGLTVGDVSRAVGA